MNQRDVEEILVAARVDPTDYSFDSGSREAVCFTHYDGPGWRVYAAERGQRREKAALRR